MNFAEHALMREGAGPVLVFSLEMPGDALMLRMLSSLGRINQSNIRSGQLTDEDWPRLTSTMSLLKERKLFIDDTAALSPNEMRARAAREHGKISMILVDYLQLMQIPGNSENRAGEISEISRSLKGLAKEMECPVIAGGQLNRSSSSGRTNGRSCRTPRIGRHRAGCRPDLLHLQGRGLQRELGAGHRRDHHRQAAERPDRHREPRVHGPVHQVRISLPSATRVTEARMHRRARAEIDADALRHNHARACALQCARAAARHQGRRLRPRHARRGGVLGDAAGFIVADVQEGIDLRAAGLHRILVLQGAGTARASRPQSRPT